MIKNLELNMIPYVFYKTIYHLRKNFWLFFYVRFWAFLCFRLWSYLVLL